MGDAAAELRALGVVLVEVRRVDVVALGPGGDGGAEAAGRGGIGLGAGLMSVDTPANRMMSASVTVLLTQADMPTCRSSML